MSVANAGERYNVKRGIRYENYLLKNKAGGEAYVAHLGGKGRGAGCGGEGYLYGKGVAKKVA